MKQVLLQEKIDKVPFDEVRMQINVCIQQAKSVDYMFLTKEVEELDFNYNLVRLENDQSEKEKYKELNKIINQGYQKVKQLVDEARNEHLKNAQPKEKKNDKN